MSSDESIREERAQDFWDVGLDLASIADDRRIREFFSSFPDAAADDMYRPYREMLLSEERRAELETRYPPAFRREHGRRWAFAEVLKALGKEGHKLFGDFARGPFWYSIPSHILHADAFAVASAWDRFHQRTEEQRLVMELAHTARLISDMLFFGYMRIYAIGRRRQIPPADVQAWWRGSRNIRHAMDATHEDFRGAVYDGEEA